MKEQQVRLAVVGVGHWGKNHARICDELGVLHVVADTDPQRRAWAKERFPGVDVVADAYEVFARSDVDGVILATPAATHYALTREALRQGKDVLVEKPLALRVQEAQELVELAARLDRVLMVGHVLEYHPAVGVLEQLIHEGELGRIRYLYSNRLNWGRIRTEENILWSFAPHDVALMLRFLKQEPRQVSAFGKAYLSPEVADVTLTILEFAGGVQGHIFVSWLHPFKEQRFVVVGEKHIAVFDDTQPWERKLVLYSHQVDWKGMVPIARKAAGEAVPLDAREPLKEEVLDFVRSIVQRSRPVADGASALRVLKVLEAAQHSLDNHGKQVPLPQVTEEKPRYFVHSTAVVDEGAEIGEGTKIWHFSHVMGGARIGRQCVLGQNVFVGRNVVIGNRCKIQNNVSVYEGVILEDGVFCGPSMVFTNVINPRAEVERKDEFRKTLVRRGATLGANSTIVCGVTIGRYAFVGAGAVVTKDVPDYALVVGVPARVVGWMCACGVKLAFDAQNQAQCNACGRRYVKEGDQVIPVEEGDVA